MDPNGKDHSVLTVFDSEKNLDLTMSVVPFSEQGQLAVTGVEGGPLTLPIEKKSPVTTARIQVTGRRPVIGKPCGEASSR